MQSKWNALVWPCAGARVQYLYTLLLVLHPHRFVEAIPQHINAKGGFESMAKFMKYYCSGTLRLAATRDMVKGEEVFVQHAPDAVQWTCFHAEKCTSGIFFSWLP